MNQFLQGAIAMATAAVGLFFLRFWRTTRDRFFLWFALSFFVEAVHRVYSGLNPEVSEDTAYHYLVRLVSYAFILWAIWEKNLPKRSGR